jgi:hypothetical protein
MRKNFSAHAVANAGRTDFGGLGEFLGGERLRHLVAWAELHQCGNACRTPPARGNGEQQKQLQKSPLLNKRVKQLSF